MKKYTLALVLAAVIPVVAANAYEYNTTQTEGYYTTRPAKTYKKTTTSRKTGGYNNTITNNFYYAQPAQSSAYVTTAPKRVVAKPAYERYEDDGYVVQEKQVSKVKKSYSSQERKYFLAHPFFQPLKGKFGSVTDVSYATNKFNFDILNGTVYDLNTNPPKELATDVLNPALSGKAKTTQFAIKEDVSVGLTDTLALILMAQYDKTKVTFKDWSSGDPAESTSDSGLNIFGVGLQNRFVDNEKWIAMVSGYFQHQKDTANTLIGELKIGYKITRNTIYGLGRFGYSDLIDGDTYGAFVKDSTGDYIMLTYQRNVNDVIYAEGGLGIFSVLNKYFTLNGELIYGYYDWHNQLSVKGAIGWQPGDMFALNLYASTSLYDSAKKKTKHYLNYDVNPEGYEGTTSLAYTIGDYKIKDYNEWKIGVQAILYF